MIHNYCLLSVLETFRIGINGQLQGLLPSQYMYVGGGHLLTHVQPDSGSNVGTVSLLPANQGSPLSFLRHG